MNRFLRSALFPVVVITLIVWLGTQTLMNNHSKTKRETLSDLYAQVNSAPGTIKQVVFNPNKHQAQVAMVDTTKYNVYYASDQSQADLQKQHEKSNVAFDSKGIGTSAWWSILTSLLPFVPCSASGSSS